MIEVLHSILQVFNYLLLYFIFYCYVISFTLSTIDEMGNASMDTFNASMDNFPELDDGMMDMYERIKKISDVSRYAVPVTIGIFLVIGMLGNLAVIYLSVKSRRIIKHPVHSPLVVNLAVSDLIYLLVSAPYYISTHLISGWIYGQFLCPFLYFASHQTISVSIFTMSCLAILRFLAIVIPFKMQKSFITTAGNRAATIFIAGIWIAGTVVAVLPALHYRVINSSHGAGQMNSTGQILPECEWIKGGFKAYFIIFFALTFILPFLLVTVLYIVILRVLYKMRRSQTLRQQNSSSSYSSASTNQTREKKEYLWTTYMVFILIGGFLICWFPYHMYRIITLFRNNPKTAALTLAVLELVGHCSSYAHAVVNPIIYTFAAPGFRQSIRNFWNKKCFKNKFKEINFTKLSQRRLYEPSPAMHRFSRESTNFFTMGNLEGTHEQAKWEYTGNENVAIMSKSLL